MSAIQLREGVWSVGVLNPALRVFDIVMESRYGTSYNAYLVTGGEKTALTNVGTDGNLKIKIGRQINGAAVDLVKAGARADKVVETLTDGKKQ